MKIKNILFDLDGVLVDAKEWHFKSLNKALLDICNYEISFEDHISKYDGLPTKIKLCKLIEQNKISKDINMESVFKLKQHYTLQLIAEYCIPEKNKIDMMNNLSMYRKACITNSIYKTAYEMLVRSGLNYYMEYVQGNEATCFPKPNPSPYLKAMSNMGILPVETLIIEDNEHGITAAKTSGAHVLEVKTTDDVNYENILRRIGELNG